MTYREVFQISDEIDEILKSKGISEADAVFSVSFHISRMLYSLGIKDDNVEEAVDNIAKDIVSNFRDINDVCRLVRQYVKDDETSN